ncbi:DeoR/GlpR family DNA-binding transcription regulator [Herbiconiux sp. CPCC 203407]|uniref:Lactose phosphotransferase system repressor n=1 Tax=Herbiconiux oxytropis TaxID=2970915 RepID=A0AA42BRX9_9MICO|nr:DeoR/GlpR family DNA-binding transcription regulator [Herbiconiux oxytropis]MCS5721018.1 DeoR/GlpR family DNA-binding transcription regulator [Herbiconiux oxytropis]MCS5724670.1 DeoR/GlpR family DNA-binding transcription regulator [Herbiconiux oxytropis]
MPGPTESGRRREQLLAILERDNIVRLTEAASDLGVSVMTIRRDLADLEGEGMLRRVRGGAISVIGPRPFDERQSEHSRAKEVIAEKALALVPRFGSIAFDASTTVGTLAERLGPRSGLTVTTNSYPTYAVLKGTTGVTPILIGGETEETTDTFVGPLAVQAAESLRYLRFFASASAIDSGFGTTEVSLAEAQMKRAFFRVSKELVLCIDSSKLQQQSTAASFELSRASVLITELSPADPRLDDFRDLVELR